MKKGEKEQPVKRTDSMQWIVDSVSGEVGKLNKKVYKPMGIYKHYSNEADKVVKFCPKCRHTWEIEKYYQDKKWKEMFYRYTHITGYGKKKEVCIDCK